MIYIQVRLSFRTLNNYIRNMIYVMYNGYNYNIHKYTSVLVIKSEDKRQSPNQEGAPGKIVTIRDLGSSIFYAVVGKKED